MSMEIKMQIVTNAISIKNNHLPEGQFTVLPKFTRTTGETEDGKYYTELSVEISNTEKNPFPFDIFASLTGIFELDGKSKDVIDTFLKINAVQILFPYLRSMVSSITSTSLTLPIVLPIINPETLFPEEVN